MPMKRIATLTLAMLTITGMPFADEITQTTEQRTETVTAEPVLPRGQEHSASSYRREEKLSSTSSPLQSPRQETTTSSTREEQTSTVVTPPAPVQQTTIIEKRST